AGRARAARGLPRGRRARRARRAELRGRGARAGLRGGHGAFPPLPRAEDPGLAARGNGDAARGDAAGRGRTLRMTCRSFEELAAALCRPEGASVDAETRAEALAHAETCETCALQLREGQRLGRGLAALAGATAAREAPPYVEAALRAAF